MTTAYLRQLLADTGVVPAPRRQLPLPADELSFLALVGLLVVGWIFGLGLLVGCLLMQPGGPPATF